jgi:hypothetical protein
MEETSPYMEPEKKEYLPSESYKGILIIGLLLLVFYYYYSYASGDSEKVVEEEEGESYIEEQIAKLIRRQDRALP